MSGYTPYMAGAAAAAKRINKIVAYHGREALRQEYGQYKAEAKACGYEVESFDEWLGEGHPYRAPETMNSRQQAESRVLAPGYANIDDALYYGDIY
jgi:hypothetical protein